MRRDDPTFLRYYAAVLTREADARTGQFVDWLRAGAERALREADAIEQAGAVQGDLFGGLA